MAAPQYSDLPPGAEVVEYSDLPPGAEVVSRPPLAIPSGPSLPIPKELQIGNVLTSQGAMPYRQAIVSGPLQPAGQAEQAMGFGVPAKQTLQESGRAAALGAVNTLPVMTAGASIPLQTAVMGGAGAAQSKLQGGSNKEAAISGTLGAGLGALPAIFPSTLRSSAAAQLAAFTKRFGNLSVDTAGPGNVALEALDQANAGATLPKVLRNFISRVATPEAPPLTLAEARKFASNASSQSIKEVTAQNAQMQRLVGQFTGEMHKAIGEASGQPETYYNALKAYSEAKGYTNVVDALKDVLLKQAKYAAIGAAGGAGAAAGYKFVHR